MGGQMRGRTVRPSFEWTRQRGGDEFFCDGRRDELERVTGLLQRHLDAREIALRSFESVQ